MQRAARTMRASGRGTRTFPSPPSCSRAEHRGAVLAFYRFVRAADDIADAADLGGRREAGAARRARAGARCRRRRRSRRRRASTPSTRSTGPGSIAGARSARAPSGRTRSRRATPTGRSFSTTAASPPIRSAASCCVFTARADGRTPRPTRSAPRCRSSTTCRTAARPRALDRIYLPIRLDAVAGGEAAFFDPRAAPSRRAVLDAVLDRVDELIDQRAIPAGASANRRLRAQSVATIALADALSRRLRRDDPILTRVQVSKADAAWRSCAAFAARSQTACRSDAPCPGAVVRRSGSSFRLGMQSLVRGAPARHPRRLCLLPRRRRHRRRGGAGGREAPLPRRLAARDRPAAPARRKPRSAASSPGPRRLFDLPLEDATPCSTAWRRTRRPRAPRRRSRARPLRPPRRRLGRRAVDPHLRGAGGARLRARSRAHAAARQHPARRGRGRRVRAGLRAPLAARALGLERRARAARSSPIRASPAPARTLRRRRGPVSRPRTRR